MRLSPASFFLLTALALATATAQAQVPECPTPTPVQGAALAPGLQFFPATNWWNLDIRTAPVDANSAAFISFINNGGTRRLHPDFGGEEFEGSDSIYGFPYAVVAPSQPKVAVTFDYWDESDGVDMDTAEGIPFYPVPTQARTQPHWIEGGSPGNVDERADNDRHLLMVDCENKELYELYNVWYDTGANRWYGGSGAYFDLTSNQRRPEGWTSADAAGLAIFPGLVRYDEAANPDVPEINHAFRVTVRDTNGHVYPASHTAGDRSGALPMGARLRLKASVNGEDPALRTSDPIARKIFRAMQKYGLIVADNGTDMYISGTFDVRWDNGELNPAFRTLTASDFEVVQLGWNPPPTQQPALLSVSANPNPVRGGSSSTGTVLLDLPAGANGASVALTGSGPGFSVPASVQVPAGQQSANFPIGTRQVWVHSAATLSASYLGVTRTSTMTVTPKPPMLSIADARIVEGNAGQRQLVFKVRLSAPLGVPVTYGIVTSSGSATSGVDFAGKGLTGETLPAGATVRTFTVVIQGDATAEQDETFRVSLHSATGAEIDDNLAIGRIINDDAPVQVIDNPRMHPNATPAAAARPGAALPPRSQAKRP